MIRQSRCYGGFGGLNPPNKAPSPPNLYMKHHNLVEFLSNLNVKSPLHKRKAPLLTPFWRRFCDKNSWIGWGLMRPWLQRTYETYFH